VVAARPRFPAQLGQAGEPSGMGRLGGGDAIVPPQWPALPPDEGRGSAKPVAPILTAGSMPMVSTQDSGLAEHAGDRAKARVRMVERLQAQAVASIAVLRTMAVVERHRFVDPGLGSQAYEDLSLPIGWEQTISRPATVARMVDLLLDAPALRSDSGPVAQSAPPPGRVLEIGTGCGYQAAVLSRLVREVYSIERLRAMHEKARANLRPFRLANLHLLLGDGSAGYASGAPYAGILVAASADSIPDAWCQQLSVGGRLVAPIVVPGSQGLQQLLTIERTTAGLKRTFLEQVHFVPLKSGIA
jgi:protein-L-isoaspartate(D-aspartate) O-methyltransferase